MKLFEVYPLFDVEPVKAEGAFLSDEEGNKYLDFYGGHAVISVGHGHPHFVDRITNQLGKLAFYSNSVPIKLQQEFASKLGELSGYASWNLFLCNSGAEANENALKLASAHNGRKKVMAFTGGFHGRTSLAVAATDNPSIVFPVNEGAEILRFDFEDFEATELALKNEDVCCVLIEGIQGVGGIVEPSTEFLLHLRRVCDDTGTFLILDEVQSGFGRSGRFFAHQHAHVTPDIISIAKGMGNGFPVGGIMIHPHLSPKIGMLGTTFGGSHLACAAGLAVLEVIEQECLIQNASQVGALLMDELAEVSAIHEIRGKGLMIGLEFDFPIAEMRKQLLYNHRVFTGSSSNKNTLRLLPPLTIAEKEVNQFIDALKKVIS